MLTNRARIFGGGAAFGIFMLAAASGTLAADAQHYSFGYDQPHTTAYGIAADIFAAKLAELSKGTMLIDQFPGAQLGQEPQMLQKIAPATSTSSSAPRPTRRRCRRKSGVMSIHFLFRSEDHLCEGVADAGVVDAVRADVRRDGEGRARADPADPRPAQPLRQEGDPQRRRHQGREGARAGDADRGHHVPGLWRADRAHAVRLRLHRLQTGVVDMAENGINVYLSQQALRGRRRSCR